MESPLLIFWSVLFVLLWVAAALLGDASSRRRMAPWALLVWLPIAGCLIMASGVFEFGPEREVIGWFVAFALVILGLLAFLLGVLVLVDAIASAKRRGVNFVEHVGNAGRAIVARARKLRGFPDD